MNRKDLNKALIAIAATIIFIIPGGTLFIIGTYLLDKTRKRFEWDRLNSDATHAETLVGSERQSTIKTAYRSILAAFAKPAKK